MAAIWLSTGANIPDPSKNKENQPSIIAEWERRVAGNVPQVLVSYDELMVESYDSSQSATGLYLQFYDQEAGTQSTILCLSTDTDDNTATTPHLRLFLRVIGRLEKEGRKNKDTQVLMCLGFFLEEGGKFGATSCSNLRPTGGNRRLTNSQEDALKQMCNKAINAKVASLPQIELIELKLKVPGFEMDKDLDFVKQLAMLGVGKGKNLFEDVMGVTEKGLVSEGVEKEKAAKFLKAVVKKNEEMALETLREAKTNDNTEQMRKALALAKTTKVPDSDLKEFQEWLDNRPLNDSNFDQAVKKWLAGGNKLDEVRQKHGHISKWDVAEVTRMSRAFDGAEFFNEPLDEWNVSSVTTMEKMFSGAKAFNQPIENWNVSKCTSFIGMFHGACSFNQPLEKWDVSKCTSFIDMFHEAHSFNQALEKWDVSKCTSFIDMFRRAYSFNQPLKKWDVSKGQMFIGMFENAKSFNQQLDNWNVSNGTDFTRMFHEASRFKQPLRNWDVSKAASFDDIFPDNDYNLIQPATFAKFEALGKGKRLMWDGMLFIDEPDCD